MTKRQKKLCSIPACHNKASRDIGIVGLVLERYIYYCALHGTEVLELIVTTNKETNLLKRLKRYSEVN